MDATSGAAKDGKESGAAEVAAEMKPASGSTAEPGKPAEVVEEFPDPDEDDLDDLDDMLDEFSTAKIASKPAEATETNKPDPIKAPAASSSSAEPEPDFGDMTYDELKQQVPPEVKGLLDTIDSSPELQNQFEEVFKRLGEVDFGDGDPQSEEMQGRFVQEMFKQMADVSQPPQAPFPPSAAPSSSTAHPAPRAAPSGSTADAAPKPATATAEEDEASFGETIRRTMERMQASGDQATAAAASGNADDFLTEMLKQMSSGDFSGEGGEEDFSKMLMGMMEQLTNKDILYEPMKELDDKFPDWMAKNRASTSEEDLKRYDEQRAVVAEIVAKFEESTYSDANAADREYIVERMQKMQAAGSPPADLVGDMASAQDALAATEDQCNPQ